jgi:N-acetylglucosaminylphosphatidylinositol deacetylase
MQLEWLTILSLPIVAIACWLYTVSVAKSRFPTLRNKRICLLIAHPDDEAMFFAPTLLALTDPSLGNHVKILCLSSGRFCFLVVFATRLTAQAMRMGSARRGRRSW